MDSVDRPGGLQCNFNVEQTGGIESLECVLGNECIAFVYDKTPIECFTPAVRFFAFSTNSPATEVAARPPAARRGVSPSVQFSSRPAERAAVAAPAAAATERTPLAFPRWLPLP